MGLKEKLKHEMTSLALATAYFGLWVGSLVLLKTLILEEYQIEFNGLSKAIVGVLVLSKVVLILENVSFGRWVRSRPAWVDVLLRTLLYALGVVAVLLLEKALDGRHEHGGFIPSLEAVFQHADIPHVWANAICVIGALLGYNVLSVIRRSLGKGALLRMFLTPIQGTRQKESVPAVKDTD